MGKLSPTTLRDNESTCESSACSASSRSSVSNRSKRIKKEKKQPVYHCEHDKCRRTFITEKKYQEHLKNHKVYACHLCSSTFPENFRLKQHLKTHEAAEEKTYKCHYPGCNHGYHVKHRLDVHIQSKHLK